MIKLSTFVKLNISTVTRFTVHVGSADGQIADYFTVNYCDQDMERLNKAILKRMDLEKNGARVDMFDVAFDHALNVTVII